MHGVADRGGKRRRRSGGRRHFDALRRWRATPLAMAAAYLLLLALFGGGPAGWTPAYTLLTLATIVFAAAVAWQDGFASLARAPLAGRIAVVAVAALPLLQLVPLPPAIWRALPGQALRGETLDLVGLGTTWQPMTLAPMETALVGVLGVGFLTLVTLLLRLDDAAFRRILTILLGVVLFNVVIGTLQVVSDGQVPRLYPVNTGAVMLGVYANKNHMGLVIACAMVLFAFVNGARIADSGRRRITVGGAVAFALVCIVTTNSRAALLLGAIGAAIVLADLTRTIGWRWRLAAVGFVVAFAAAILASNAFDIVSARFGDVDEDLRWRILHWSMPLAERYGVLGSGGGSFMTLFNVNEQLAWVKPTYVNAAHNDYVQLVIEFGGPGILALLMLLASLPRGVKAARGLPLRDERRQQAWFGVLVVLMIAAHSVVDYPLRRPSCWVFLAVALVAVYRAGKHDRQAT